MTSNEQWLKLIWIKDNDKYVTQEIQDGTAVAISDGFFKPFLDITGVFLQFAMILSHTLCDAEVLKRRPVPYLYSIFKQTYLGTVSVPIDKKLNTIIGMEVQMNLACMFDSN